MEKLVYSSQLSTTPSELSKLNLNDYGCRNCQSRDLEVLFHFPKTFFWYGIENVFLEKNIITKYSDATLFFCNSCEFIGSPVSNRLRNQLSTYYQSPYSVPGATPGQDSKYCRSLADSFFSSFSELEPGWIPEKVLEVGCQRGYLLSEFRARGAKKVIGIEPGQVEPWVDKSGFVVDVRRGLLSKEILEDEKNFDLVYSLQVFEHVEDPNEFLQIIYDALKVGGRIHLVVPNELFSFKEGNVGMFLFQHLNYFTPGTLQSLLNKNGFKVTGLISSRHKELMVMGEKMSANWSSNCDSPIEENIRSLFKDYQRKVQDKLDYIKNLSDRLKGEPLGFYGVAGTPNIFSWIPDLRERPVAVFDSDSSTWGKHFGGVPCSVQPPANLNTIEHIIPSPFRLHDEIAKYIEGHNGKNLKIHRLY
jgi:SAM-dependent methyltransferase